IISIFNKNHLFKMRLLYIYYKILKVIIFIQDKGGTVLLTLYMAIFLPFLAALLIPIFYRRYFKIHIGWFVLIVPTILFITLISYLPQIKQGSPIIETLNWIPSFGINLTSYLDGLSLIFGLLITGIGALVVFYSVFYLDTSENLGHF